METHYDIKSLISKAEKTSVDSYIPQLMVYCSNPNTYTSLKFFSNLEQIDGRSKSTNIFEAKTINDFTPAHLAVMSNNIAGLNFLFRQNISIDIADKFGKKPLEYCKFGSDIYTSLTYYSIRTSAYNELLTKWKINLPDTPFTYQANTHDFGVEIKKLLFKKPTEKQVFEKVYVSVENIPENMQKIAKIEGFEIQLTKTNCIPRDAFIRISDGSFKIPSASTNVTAAIDKYDSLALITIPSMISCSEHVYFTQTSQGAVNNFKEYSTKEFLTTFPISKNPSLDFYVEGGNYFILTNRENNQIIVMGKDQLQIALNQLRLDKYFNKVQDQLNEKIDKIAPTLTLDIIRNTFLEMYSQGQLVKSKNCPKGYLNFDERVVVESKVFSMYGVLNRINKINKTPINPNAYYNCACALKSYIPLQLTDTDLDNQRNVAAKYLAQKEMTKELMAQSLGVSKENIHFTTPLSLHIDQVMHPGPKGSMFVQDFTLSVEVLQHIKLHPDSYTLTKLDREILERYLIAMKRLEIQTKPLIENIHKELKEAGMIVIPTPGNFFDVTPQWLSNDYKTSKTFNVNFLNSVTGKSPKSEFFWITTGAKVGDNLGVALMGCFQKFLNSYQKMAVHYVGYNPKNPTDFSEGMIPWNSQANGSGPHCMSLELETASYTHG